MSPASPHTPTGRFVAGRSSAPALAACVMGVLACAALLLLILQPPSLVAGVRATWFLLKVRMTKAAASDYMLLGRTSSWIGEEALRDAVRADDPHISEAGLKALYLHYPDSPESQACREFEEIRAGSPGGWDRGYFWRYERRSGLPARPLTPAAAVAQWQHFLQRYPGFSGADDASLHLARAQTQLGQMEAAAITLQRGLSLGDYAGYTPNQLRTKLRRLIDHGSNDEALANLEAHKSFAPLSGLLRYSRAINAARHGHFSTAAAYLAAIEADLAQDQLLIDRRSLNCNSDYYMAVACDASPGWQEAAQGQFMVELRLQRQLFQRVSQWQLQEHAALASNLPALAWRARVAQARLLMSDRHALLNLLIHECSDAVSAYFATRIYDAGDSHEKRVGRSARLSRSELVACDLVSSFLSQGASRSQQATALQVRAQALTRLSREWAPGHRSHLVIASGDGWKTRAHQARDRLRQHAPDAPCASAMALGGITAAGSTPRPTKKQHSTLDLAATAPETPR